MKVFVDTSAFVSLFVKQDAHHERVDETIFSQAKDALIRFCEHKISFTDCTSYVLFKKLALDEVFTLDSDFKKLNIPVSFPHLSS